MTNCGKAKANPRPETGVGNFNKTQIDMKNKFETLSDSKFMKISDKEQMNLTGGLQYPAGPPPTLLTHIVTYYGHWGHVEAGAGSGGGNNGDNGYDTVEDSN